MPPNVAKCEDTDMTTQNKSTVASWVAVATVIYLVLGLMTNMVRSEILDVLFLPGIYMMIVPTPVLDAFGLANHGFLLAPTTAGVIVLLVLYAGLAYVVARYIESALLGQPPHQ
jgi:hypothetical protein